MSPASFNAFSNGNGTDLDMSFYTLEEAIDMVEFQESLVVDDIDWEEVEFEEEVL
jgi:hypothetical protein